MKKIDIGPMHASPRCTAHSKRTGEPCKSPAVNGWKVCRMHGARGGGQTGSRNGNYRHGGRTQRTQAALALIQAMARICRKTAEDII